MGEPKVGTFIIDETYEGAAIDLDGGRTVT